VEDAAEQSAAFASAFCVVRPSPLLAKAPIPAGQFIVGFARGSTARIIATKLSDVIDTPVIVENRPGAGNILSTGYVAHATPDGYTIFSWHLDRFIAETGKTARDFPRQDGEHLKQANLNIGRSYFRHHVLHDTITFFKKELFSTSAASQHRQQSFRSHDSPRFRSERCATPERQ
jgi:hypothetical protein